MNRLASSVLLVALSAAPAAAQSPFAQTVTFGDSMTANDPLAAIFHGPPALWGMDPMEAVFAKAAATGDRLTDYSALAARATELRVQLGRYGDRWLGGQQGLATFISWQAGTNEFLNASTVLRRDAPGTNAATDGIVNQFLLSAFQQIWLLVQFHPAAHIALWTIPDVTLQPVVWGLFNAQETANVRAHLQRANDVLRAFEVFPQVAVVDFDAVWSANIAAPPMVGTRQLIGPPVWGRGDALFAEPFHPTAAFNAIIANAFIAHMNSRWGWNVPTYSQSELEALTRVP